jgi:hypothetical protein
LCVDGIDVPIDVDPQLNHQRGDMDVRGRRADMAELIAKDRYSLVFVAASIIFQQEIRPVAYVPPHAAAALTRGSRFVVERSTPAAVAYK